MRSTKCRLVITQADGRRGVGFSPAFVCVSACLSVCFSARYLKTDASRITKLDTEMFHDDSWKPIYFGIKGQKSISQVIKTLPAWVFALLWVLESSSFCCSCSTSIHMGRFCSRCTDTYCALEGLSTTYLLTYLLLKIKFWSKRAGI